MRSTNMQALLGLSRRLSTKAAPSKEARRELRKKVTAIGMFFMSYEICNPGCVLLVGPLVDQDRFALTHQQRLAGILRDFPWNRGVHLGGGRRGKSTCSFSWGSAGVAPASRYRGSRLP